MQIKYILSSVFAIVLSAGFQSCSKSSDTGTTTTPPPNTKVVSIKADSKFGNVLTNSSGAALYFFAIDANGSSGCTGGCAANWPAFYNVDTTNVGAGLNAADFRTITRSDGAKQTTYKGWPLYTYAGDGTSGGGLWPNQTIL
jgi:predicted lipoprotein with Yx(FWY)xxD motif